MWAGISRVPGSDGASSDSFAGCHSRRVPASAGPKPDSPASDPGRCYSSNSFRELRLPPSLWPALRGWHSPAFCCSTELARRSISAWHSCSDVLFHNAISAIVAGFAQLGEIGAAVIIGLLALYVLVRWIRGRILDAELRRSRISAGELANLIEKGKRPLILDIRESDLRQRQGVIPGALAIMASHVAVLSGIYPPETMIIVYSSHESAAPPARGGALPQTSRVPANSPSGRWHRGLGEERLSNRDPRVERFRIEIAQIGMPGEILNTATRRESRRFTSLRNRSLKKYLSSRKPRQRCGYPGGCGREAASGRCGTNFDPARGRHRQPGLRQCLFLQGPEE